MTAEADVLRIPAILRAIVVSAALLAWPVAAGAGPVADKAAEAETLLDAGRPADAFDALNAAVDAFWTAAPLVIGKAYFVTGGDNGGAFAPRPDGPFKPSDTIRIHVAPLGYGFTETGGQFRIELATDIEIRTPGGLIIAKAEDFGHLEWQGPGKSRNFNGRVAIALPELKPGEYEVFLTVRDQATQKSADVSLPFSVAAE